MLVSIQRTCTHARTHMRTHAHTHTHTYAHTHTYTHTHTHKQTPQMSKLLLWKSRQTASRSPAGLHRAQTPKAVTYSSSIPPTLRTRLLTQQQTDNPEPVRRPRRLDSTGSCGRHRATRWWCVMWRREGRWGPSPSVRVSQSLMSCLLVSCTTIV